MASLSMLRTMRITSFLLPLLLSLAGGAEGREDSANHLLLFDSLPGGIPSHKPVALDVRTNLSGSVQLVESRDFRVVVNITAPSLQQAYDVKAELFSLRGGIVLQIKEEKAVAGIFNLTWLVVAAIALTIIVGIFTLAKSIQWYKLECKQSDFPEHKSFASSSQQGTVYRSRNSIQMVHLPPEGEGGMRGDEDFQRNLRCDEELRQVTEMPEEEEAEERELEQLQKKLQGEADIPAETEDSDPQERNLIQSKFNSQAKTVHKDMIRKSGGGRKAPPSRRTQNGMYTGVPTEQEEGSEDDTDDIIGSKERFLSDSSDSRAASVVDLQVNFEGRRGTDGSMSTFGKGTEKVSNLKNSDTEPAYANDPSETDPMMLVLADVHKTNSSKGDKQGMGPAAGRPGNLYMKPSELKPVVMSTFGMDTSTPKKGVASRDSGNGTSSGNETAEELFQNVAQKYQLDGSWFAQTFASMGDIPEDPREDQQSVVSGSAKSTSMYGSSEIFDAGDDGNTYYNLDSDIDIPPLDGEDVFSDGGLPSPLGFPMNRPGEKGRVNDDIKLIPGALKSPGPNTPRMLSTVKPRPNSSIILGGGDRNKTGGDTGSQVASGSQAAVMQTDISPPLPPPPEQDRGLSDTVFEFPPPPNFYKPPPHMVARKQREGEQTGGAGGPNRGSGEYVQIQRPGNKSEGSSQETSGQRRGGKPGTKLAPTYMNLTLLSTLCVLTLASGVYSAMSASETKVEVTMFIPKHFFTNNTRVFFNFEKDTEAMNTEDVLVYDVSNPLISNLDFSHHSCANRTCEQGCDELSGRCMCRKGYRLDAKEKCVDVNECMEAKFKCNSAAGCYNRKGSYDCICGEDFYSFGKTCRECSEPCPENHYEVWPCTKEKPKACEACSLICRPGYYMARACSANKKDLCRVCRSPCEPWEFESRQCTNLHDRECTNSTELPAPKTSKNVILEDRGRVRDDVAQLDKLPAHYVGFSRYKLYRGTGLYVSVTVYFMDAAQQFLPVNVTQPFNLDLVAPAVLKSYPVQRYCPTPIPDYYILRYRKHEGITYKQNENGSLEACETHKQFGDFLPSPPNRGQSFLCSQPGSLSETFKVNEDFFLARTKWVDKSRRCQRHSRTCEQCTRKCGTDMLSGDPACSVAAEADSDNDNGYSPRLRTCYNCCVKRNCSETCKDYHKRRCQPEQCSKGNLLEYTMEPSWDSSQNGGFFCHIAPLPRQQLLELEYTVAHVDLDSPLHTGKVKVMGNQQWEETGVLETSDGVISVVVNSSLGKLPDFLEGGTTQESSVFKVGSYKSHGAHLGASAIRMDYAFIRPPTLKGVPPMPQSHQECSNPGLQDMILASNMENPYIRNSELEAHAINYTTPFRMLNKRKEPVVLAKLLKETSILGQMFPAATLVPGTFSGSLTQTGGQWVVHVTGRVQSCPGYLHIQLKDPGYSSRSLFDCDTVVRCPNEFSLTFQLPTSDKEGMFKDVIVSLGDKHGVHNHRVFRRSKLEAQLGAAAQDPPVEAPEEQLPVPYAMTEKDRPEGSGPRATPDLPIAFPVLLGIAGTIILLLVLAILGFCFQPGLPETLYANWYHPLFAMGYMMMQFLYSLVVTGTVFFLILSVITSEHVNFVLQYGQQGAVSTASSHIELLQLQRHLEGEIARQDAHLDTVQEECLADVELIIADLRKLHSDLLNSTEDVFHRYRLELLLDQQKLHVRERLTRDLETFRQNYATAAQAVLRQVNQNALASFQNVEHNNTWLDGVRFLHGAVMLLRKAHDKEQKSFMDWTHIKADLAKLEIDLSFSLPALPRLDDIPVAPPDSPAIHRMSDPNKDPEKEPIRTIQMHNNWFFPLQESGIGGASLFQSVRSKGSEGSSQETSLAFYIFLGLFIACDLVLLAHRMFKAWTTANLIIFGFPEYFRERKEEDMADDAVFESKESKTRLGAGPSWRENPNFQAIKTFVMQTISATLFPKMVFAVAACVVSVCLLQLGNRYLTVKELGRVGFYHSADEYVDLQALMTNARIQTHADYINTVDFPAFQATVSGHAARHWTILDLYHKHLLGLQKLSMDMYCQHLKAIGLAGNCSDQTHKGKDSDHPWKKMDAVSHACKFYPVVPRLFTRLGEDKRPVSEVQVEALLESLRFIIYYSCQLLVIYLTVVLLKELACAVVWIFLQRSGVIRLRIIVEQDQDASLQ